MLQKVVFSKSPCLHCFRLENQEVLISGCSEMMSIYQRLKINSLAGKFIQSCFLHNEAYMKVSHPHMSHVSIWAYDHNQTHRILGLLVSC